MTYIHLYPQETPERRQRARELMHELVTCWLADGGYEGPQGTPIRSLTLDNVASELTDDPHAIVSFTAVAADLVSLFVELTGGFLPPLSPEAYWRAFIRGPGLDRNGSE